MHSLKMENGLQLKNLTLSIRIFGKDKLDEIIDFDSKISWNFVCEEIKKILSFDEYLRRHRELFLKLYKNSKKNFFIVATKNKKLIGLLWLGIKLDTVNYIDICYVYDIEVLEKYRGQGIGTMLMKKAEEICKRNKINRMALSVSTSNPVTKWYLQLGFKIKRFYLEKTFNLFYGNQSDNKSKSNY